MKTDNEQDSIWDDYDSDCQHCDSPGGVKTYKNQACMPINGKVRCIDWCIHHMVAALNAGGVRTVASCCGHKKMIGRIDLEDGRVLLIVNKVEADHLEWHALQQKKHPSTSS